MENPEFVREVSADDGHEKIRRGNKWYARPSLPTPESENFGSWYHVSIPRKTREMWDSCCDVTNLLHENWLMNLLSPEQEEADGIFAEALSV